MSNQLVRLNESVAGNRQEKLILILLFSLVVSWASAQDSSRSALFTGDFAIKPSLFGQHPRLLNDTAAIGTAQELFKTEPTVFAKLLPNPAKPHGSPPVALQDKENAFLAQNIAHLAVSYRITQRPEYLQALREWLPFLKRFETIKIDRKSPTTDNRDLSGGELLLGLSLAYDNLAGFGPTDVVPEVRRVLVAQARQIYDDFASQKSFHYEQNHLIIPLCGLGLAAMVLIDEFPEAKLWGVFARNLLDRSFNAIAHDGWFFEGISYWSFTMEFPVAYATALLRTTGVDLLVKPPFNQIADYLNHTFLPNPNFAFDFADWGFRVNADGTAQRGYDQPWHTVPTRVFSMIPYLLNQTHPDPRLKGNLDLLVPLNSGLPALDRTIFLMGSYRLPSQSMRLVDGPALPNWHYFADMDVLHWRSNWSDPLATALAFRAGPPAGHHIASLYPLFPEWRAGLGHAHPDAGSFILFAKGAFLANATGYATKETKWHNTLTVDGGGQGKSGTPWATFNSTPYERLDQIHLEQVWAGPSVVAARAVIGAAYESALGMQKVDRQLMMIDGQCLVIVDDLQSTKSHDYSWYLHTDQQPVVAGTNLWQMTNGQGRLVVTNLGAISSMKIEPTVVETQIYPGPSRPQQRGYHLQASSGLKTAHQFITAMVVQDTGRSVTEVKAEQTGPGRFVINNGLVSWTVWLGQQAELDGVYGFARFHNGVLMGAGLFGRELKLPTGNLKIESGESILVKQDRSGKMIAEPNQSASWGWEPRR